MRRLAATTAVAAAAAIGVIAWFVQPKSPWTKAWIFAALVGAIASTIVLPYLVRLFMFARRSMVVSEGMQERVQAERATTWGAVLTNLRLAVYPIDVLRLKLDEGFILFLIDAGSHVGVEVGMQFELAAIPDMEVYGVIRAFQVEEEKSWCVLQEGEGRLDFAAQMRDRLTSGEISPPSGYEVRPFMAAAFQWAIEQAQLGSQLIAPAPLEVEVSGADPETPRLTEGLSQWGGGTEQEGGFERE